MKGQNWTNGANVSIVLTRSKWNPSMCYCKNVHYKPMDGIDALKKVGEFMVMGEPMFP